MRKLIPLVLAGAVVCGPAFAAPPVAGVWSLPDDNVRIRIAPCGQSVCGRLISADKLKDNPRLKDKMNEDPSLRGRPVKGLLVLWGFKPTGDKWAGGRVYNPDEGKTYRSELTLVDRNTLKVSGCVLKPLCKTRTLTRMG